MAGNVAAHWQDDGRFTQADVLEIMLDPLDGSLCFLRVEHLAAGQDQCRAMDGEPCPTEESCCAIVDADCALVIICEVKLSGFAAPADWRRHRVSERCVFDPNGFDRFVRVNLLDGEEAATPALDQ